MKNNLNKKNILIFLFFAFLVLFFTRNTVSNINPGSRFITIESIVERKTLAINEKQNYTCDKIQRDGNYYSSKPPILTTTGSGIYYVLHNFFNLSLPGSGIEKYLNEENLAVYIITLILVGIPYLLLLLFFYKSLGFFKLTKENKILLFLGLSLGTLYLPYLTTLNNHVPAGSFLFISFYYLLKTKFSENKKGNKKYITLSGFFASLAAVIDLPTGSIFLFLFFIYFLINEDKKYIIYYLLAGAPIVLIHFFLQIQITGDLLPAQLHQELWAKSSIKTERDGFLLYIFNIFLGARGYFLYTPLLIISFCSIFKIIKNRQSKFRQEAIMTVIAFTVITLFYILRARDYAGFAYGFRWFIAITPIVYFFTVFVFIEESLKKLRKYLLAALASSVVIAFIGMYNPWSIPRLKIVTSDNKEIIIHSPIISNINSIVEDLQLFLKKYTSVPKVQDN
jgi:hypothetical protein